MPRSRELIFQHYTAFNILVDGNHLESLRKWLRIIGPFDRDRLARNPNVCIRIVQPRGRGEPFCQYDDRNPFLTIYRIDFSRAAHGSGVDVNLAPGAEVHPRLSRWFSATLEIRRDGADDIVERKWQHFGHQLKATDVRQVRKAMDVGLAGWTQDGEIGEDVSALLKVEGRYENHIDLYMADQTLFDLMRWGLQRWRHVMAIHGMVVRG